MKKLLFIFIIVLIIGCSSEDATNEEMCCDTTISELKESYTRIYTEIQNNPETTEQQKAEAQAEYEARMEDPCFYYKRSLEEAGASCEDT